MHLMHLRETNGCCYKQKLLDVCVTLVDATLNSWKEAHDCFNNRPFKDSRPTFIDSHTHQIFTNWTVKVIKDTEDCEMIQWGCNSYPREAIAYEVLKLWLENVKL